MDFDDISIFLYQKTGKVANAISDYYLTRKEIYELIEYLKEINYEKNIWYISRLSNKQCLWKEKKKQDFIFGKKLGGIYENDIITWNQ